MSALDVPALLERARELRAGHRAESPSPVDTAYCVTACAACGARDVQALGYEGTLRPGVDECETVMALFEALSALYGPRIGIASAPLERCPCGGEHDAPSVLALRFFHSVAGSGADVMAQSLFDDGDDAPSWSIARVPDDGSVEWLTPDEGSVARAFGPTWLRPATVLRRLATAPEGAAEPYGEGHWLYAGPGASASLDATLAALTTPARRAVAFEPAWSTSSAWRSLHTNVRPAGFRFGAVVDLATLAHMIRVQARRHGLIATRADAPLTLYVRSGELSWPVELERVARECARRGLSLPAGASAAVGTARLHLAQVGAFVDRVRAIDPTVAWRVEGTRATPALDDDVTGRAFDLRVDPFRHRASDLDLVRDVRFNVGRYEEHVDPYRVCACGAALAATLRLASWGFVEAMLGARPTEPPVVVETFSRGERREAAVFVALECSRHLRPLTSADQGRGGLSGDALIGRIERDLGHNAFMIELEASADTAGRRVVVARGAWVSSALLNPSLVAGLLRVAGDPIAGDEATVTAFGEHCLAVTETGYDPGRWESLTRDLRRQGGEGRDEEVEFVLERRLVIRVPPAGTFRLLPPAD